jgi:hypothetical protein
MQDSCRNVSTSQASGVSTGEFGCVLDNPQPFHYDGVVRKRLIEFVVAATAFYASLASVTGQAPTANFPSSLITSSPPPAILGLTNATSIPLAPLMNSSQATTPTITVPQAAPIQIPQALIPASTSAQLPTSTDTLPHTTPTMPRLPPPQTMVPTARDMAIAPVGRYLAKPQPPSTVATPSANPQTSGVITNPDGSMVVPMTSVPTNTTQTGTSSPWNTKQSEINGVKYHW